MSWCRVIVQVSGGKQQLWVQSMSPWDLRRWSLITADLSRWAHLHCQDIRFSFNKGISEALRCNLYISHLLQPGPRSDAPRSAPYTPVHARNFWSMPDTDDPSQVHAQQAGSIFSLLENVQKHRHPQKVIRKITPLKGKKKKKSKNLKFPAKAKLSSHWALSLGPPYFLRLQVSSAVPFLYGWLLAPRGFSQSLPTSKKKKISAHVTLCLSLSTDLHFLAFQKSCLWSELNFLLFNLLCDTLRFLPFLLTMTIQTLTPLHFPLTPPLLWLQDLLTHLDSQVNRINKIHASDKPQSCLSLSNAS